VVAVNWKDGNSSATSLRYVFPNSSLSHAMLCGGHVGHSHTNNLTEYNGRRSVDLSFVATHKKDYPQLATTKYVCNHFSALKQYGNDPEEYTSLRVL